MLLRRQPMLYHEIAQWLSDDIWTENCLGKDPNNVGLALVWGGPPPPPPPNNFGVFGDP